MYVYAGVLHSDFHNHTWEPTSLLLTCVFVVNTWIIPEERRMRLPLATLTPEIQFFIYMLDH